MGGRGPKLKPKTRIARIGNPTAPKTKKQIKQAKVEANQTQKKKQKQKLKQDIAKSINAKSKLEGTTQTKAQRKAAINEEYKAQLALTIQRTTPGPGTPTQKVDADPNLAVGNVLKTASLTTAATPTNEIIDKQQKKIKSLDLQIQRNKTAKKTEIKKINDSDSTPAEKTKQIAEIEAKYKKTFSVIDAQKTSANAAIAEEHTKVAAAIEAEKNAAIEAAQKQTANNVNTKIREALEAQAAQFNAYLKEQGPQQSKNTNQKAEALSDYETAEKLKKLKQDSINKSNTLSRKIRKLQNESNTAEQKKADKAAGRTQKKGGLFSRLFGKLTKGFRRVFTRDPGLEAEKAIKHQNTLKLREMKSEMNIIKEAKKTNKRREVVASRKSTRRVERAEKAEGTEGSEGLQKLEDPNIYNTSEM
jgi:hypothetical protein